MSTPSRSVARPAGSARRGFTLIELLVVVAIIAVISGLLLPVLIHARDRARKLAAEREVEQSAPAPATPARPSPTLPSGSVPVLDSLSLQMALAPSYHRIGMDVYTRYRLDCSGEVQFRGPGGAGAAPVLLTIPFPANTVEARDVELKVAPTGEGQPAPVTEVVYDRTGIYCRCSAPSDRPLTASVNFTAFGRDRLDYALPAARELRAVDISLGLPASLPRTVPDDALQPSASAPDALRWQLKNLVTDRRIEVLIPAAQAPLARALTLTRLVAIAVLLFGAGFWYLSEQVRPGQLDRFRWGHFLLLALTYSLFFVIFAVLELDGKVGTAASLGVSAVFSMPLLAFHVSRVLDLRFAITRVIPLALFTLGLVLNGVYGGIYRDYVWVGATILLIAYLTFAYQSWSTRRAAYFEERQVAYSARRSALIEEVTRGLGGLVADLAAADARAAAILHGPALAGSEESRARLKRAREPVAGLTKEYEELPKRLTYLPTEAGWEAAESCKSLEQSTEAFRSRVEPRLAQLREALETSPTGEPGEPSDSESVYCVACGHAVPDAPFCQVCGAPRPAAYTCSGCGERLVIPMHTRKKGEAAQRVFCPRCGTGVVEAPPDEPAARKKKE